ncbi:MAG: hypothetical protein M1817_000103 [Caeruleum heppii]|nr:MAG: hypothetical protein M1817_000103 [Caeruleum heppii]
MSPSPDTTTADRKTIPSDRQITLQVGECRFTTLISTLVSGSKYFATRFKSSPPSSITGETSYFVDGDPDLFAHVLRYLRRGVLPVMYDRANGFDHAFYTALEQEASYFGIDSLKTWIANKDYLRAVEIQYSARAVEENEAALLKATVDGNTELMYHPVWTTNRIFQCPRNIQVHHGDPWACGRQCEYAQGDDDDLYLDQDVLHTMVVTKKTIYRKPVRTEFNKLTDRITALCREIPSQTVP